FLLRAVVRLRAAVGLPAAAARALVARAFAVGDGVVVVRGHALLPFLPAVVLELALARRPLALLALAFSLWRCAERALLAFFVPLLAAPRLPLLRVEPLSDLPASRGAEEEELRDGMACSWFEVAGMG